MADNSNHEDFVATLESFKELKSGISGSRIRKLTDYAINHVSDVETLLSFVVQYSRDCPPTHKLGSLYIIDSIIRALLSKADSSNDENKDSTENQYSKGINFLNNNIQSLLVEGIEKSSDSHLEKIHELINIWDKNKVFESAVLNVARERMNEIISNNSSGSSAPLSSRAAKNNSDGKLVDSKIEQILNNIPKYENLPVVHIPTALFSDDTSVQDSTLQQFLGDLQAQLGQNPKLRLAGRRNSRNSDSTTSNQNTSSRTPKATQYIGRDSRSDRSRSPPRNKNERTRQQPNSAVQSSRQQQQQQQSAAMQTNNHHLYPDESNVPSNPHYRPKPVSFDPSVPRDHVKVYSRTLFVGGVPQNFKEHDIARMLRQFGEVQSVILNNARKHAFVKVYSRAEAERIMAHFTGGGNPTHGLRIRWAVGFGPRDCCDYQYGYSIIPLARLTEIDFKWSQSAEWGGTGGQPIQTNMVYEEPDIIVGEGVSSKAISQKMPTDKGVLGPKSGKVGQPSALPQPNLPYNNMSPPPPQPAPIPQQYYNQPMYQQGPPQSMMYGQNQMVNQMPTNQGPVPQQPQQQAPSPPPQQNFDPTAQLNTLMSMLNQTPK